MKCFTCKKKTGNHKKDIKICGSCREVLKVDLANMVLGLDRVYLSESNRNKSGRKHKLTATQQSDIYWAYKRKEASIRQLAKKYNVSVGTISKYIHK